MERNPKLIHNGEEPKGSRLHCGEEAQNGVIRLWGNERRAASRRETRRVCLRFSEEQHGYAVLRNYCVSFFKKYFALYFVC